MLRIAPVFAVVLAGYAGRRVGLLPQEFEGPANRLVYYVAIPCLIFLKVYQAPLHAVLRPGWVVAGVAAICLVALLGYLLSGGLGLCGGSRGTFIQASVHANLGYIGLATAFYALGEAGLQVASVFAPFFMLANNGLAVLAMGRFGERGAGAGQLLGTLLLHPVILASFAGLLWAWQGWGLPSLAAETLRILAAMALPLALLLIGSGLRVEALRHPLPVLTVVALKNLVLPAVGAALLTLAGALGTERVAATVLLGAPSATITLILAREMGGDRELAAAAVTASTLASAATLTLWLAFLGG